MIDLTQIITQVPINIYVVIGCCIVGWLMKKFLPTDNRIIPVTLTVIGAIVYVLLEGVSVANIIIGALTGAASTGLHQIFAQFVEGTKDHSEILIETGEMIEDNEMNIAATSPQTLARNDKGGDDDAEY